MGYIYEQVEKMVAQSIVIGATCDQCGKGLRPVFSGSGEGWQAAQARGALNVTISGGYGQYYDSEHGAGRCLLCKECADRLLAEFPCFARAM
jgi:hypothetical protein